MVPTPLCTIFLSVTTVVGLSAQPFALNSTSVNDLDRDGLDDQFEQQILIRFIPEFLVSETDCAGLPAEFFPDIPESRPVIFNGTIYGQVFSVSPPGLEGNFLEVHYFHLWNQDCGRMGHELDAEYVSGLITSTDNGWKALYWYAAAHEGTLCDASNGAIAATLEAEDKGPMVWISTDKHASFLSLDLCMKVGCGGDRCDHLTSMTIKKIVNLGEPKAPLNGTKWAGSKEWPLSSKMETVFDDSGMDRFRHLEPGDISFLDAPLPTTKALLLAGNKTLGALDAGNSQAGGAVSTAGEQTGNAIGLALGKAGRFFKRSVGFVRNQPKGEVKTEDHTVGTERPE
jgi:hypothetical protein